MAMMELYPQIRMGHIGLVQATGTWMALRYLGTVAGMRWPRHLAARGIAWTIDGVLLTFAAMLFTMLPTALFANGWLWVKLVLVVTYFGVGYAGLSAKRSRGQALAFGMITMLAYLLAYGIARMHDPRGWLLLLNS